MRNLPISIALIFIVFGSIVAVLITLGFAAEADLEEAIQQQDLYCEMVATYNETGGDYGWPDYRNDYNVVCNK